MILNLRQGLEAPPPPSYSRGIPPLPQPKASGKLAGSSGQPLEMYLLQPTEPAALSLQALYAAIRKQLIDG